MIISKTGQHIYNKYDLTMKVINIQKNEISFEEQGHTERFNNSDRIIDIYIYIYINTRHTLVSA